jgi:predicted nucleotidyltransferase
MNTQARRRETAAGLTPSLVRERLAPVFSRHRVLKAILFGSVARGEPSRHSDVDRDPVDRIIVQRTDKRFLDRYEGLLYDVSIALPETPVEALIYTPEELDSLARSRRFIARALEEGQVIYESDR